MMKKGGKKVIPVRTDIRKEKAASPWLIYGRPIGALHAVDSEQTLAIQVILLNLAFYGVSFPLRSANSGSHSPTVRAKFI